MVPCQRPLRRKRQIVALISQIQNVRRRRAVQKPSDREDHGGTAVFQARSLRRAVCTCCPTRAERVIRTRDKPPGSFRERAPALRQLPGADDGDAACAKQRQIALCKQHCRTALAERLPQPRGIARRQARNRDDPVLLCRAQIALQLRIARQKPHDARALPLRIAEPGQIVLRQLPQRVFPAGAEGARPLGKFLKLRHGQRPVLRLRQRAAQKQQAGFCRRQRKRRRGGAFFGFGVSSSTREPSSANFTGCMA